MNTYIKYVVLCIVWSSSSAAFEKEISDLTHRTDGQVVRVSMNSFNGVRVGPDDSERVLLTTGLGGCTAVALVAENSDGERIGILSHYFSSTERNEHVRALSNVFIGLRRGHFAQVSAIIMTPGEDGADQSHATFKDVNSSLILCIANAFERKIIKTICYDMFAQDSHHALVVRIPGTRTAKRPSYRTWFCEGEL